MKTPPLYELPIYWIPVYNQESEPVPPYGVVEIKSISSSTGIASVGKPSSDGSTAVFFNGPTPIPPAKTGQATQTKPAIAAYQADNTDCTQPVHGEEWGAESGSWYLHKGQTGFQVVGEGNYGLCNVISGPSAGATSGYSGTITHYRYTWNSTTCVMTETSQAITVVNGLITAVGSFV
jgi:hypothetical protein